MYRSTVLSRFQTPEYLYHILIAWPQVFHLATSRGRFLCWLHRSTPFFCFRPLFVWQSQTLLLGSDASGIRLIRLPYLVVFYLFEMFDCEPQTSSTQRPTKVQVPTMHTPTNMMSSIFYRSEVLFSLVLVTIHNNLFLELCLSCWHDRTTKTWDLGTTCSLSNNFNFTIVTQSTSPSLPTTATSRSLFSFFIVASRSQRGQKTRIQYAAHQKLL